MDPPPSVTDDAITAVTEVNFGWSFKMALCDYFELVTTDIVTSVWATYFLQTMVTSSGLLYIDWLAKA